jgi:hypothetical protein
MTEKSKRKRGKNRSRIIHAMVGREWMSLREGYEEDYVPKIKR